MLALRAQALAQSELRQKITGKSETAWQELVKRAYEGNDEAKKIDRVEKLMEQRGPSFDKIIQYGNHQLTEEIIPSFRKMVILFIFKNSISLSLPPSHTSRRCWNSWKSGIDGSIIHCREKCWDY